MLPCDEAQYRESRAVYLNFVEKAVELGGTVSAEHGIGKLKHAFLEKMVGKKALEEMAKLKKSLDPAGILGQGNIFPKELL
jgi:D-lactate dehydrogenase (cytochrome)